MKRVDAVRSGLPRRVFAWLLAVGAARIETLLADRKRALLAELSGDVLEIGPGTGVNLAHYRSDVRWVGVEPNVYMDRYIHEAAARRGLATDIRRGVAERLPADDASVDAVVATHVLCSVDNLDAALAEIRRVLRPGGRFVFVEHVAAARGSRLRRLQQVVRPVWRIVADGCHPDRQTAWAVERAGFHHVRYEEFQLPVPVVGPHVAGEAIR